MNSDQVKLNEIFLIFIPAIFLLLVNHYFYFFDYFGLISYNWLDTLNDQIYKFTLYIRGSFVIFLAASTYLNAKLSSKKYDNWSFLIIAIITIVLFLKGFIQNNHYNLYIYPIFFFGMIWSTIKTVQYITNNASLNIKELFPKTKKTEFSFKLNTDRGPIHITKPEYGMAIEGGAGAGKSVLIKNILHQASNMGFAGCLYDFEGDCREPGGAELSRTVMSALYDYNNKKRTHGRVGFSYLNFGDPSRTVRVNPISPKYIESSLDLGEFAKTLMTNLEPEWLKKKDFWAGNAINYCYGVMQRLYNDPSLHKYLTIPHVAMICTSHYETVFKWILQDKSLERKIMPLHVAFTEQAKSQLAGAVSSAALPIAQLLEPEIFYPLSPETDEETFNLDITNEDHPVFFCVGTIPKNKFVLGPVCSLILLVCMNNMNRFGKRRSLFVVDELPTLFIPNLDTLPATARKKDVSTILAWQSFKQVENAYGKEKAEITRDNLSNQFIGKGRNTESAERIIKFFGKTDIIKQNITASDSGDSVQFQNTREEVLQASEILNQPIGHFTGALADGVPPYFHTQFDYFEPKLQQIPFFSKKWLTTDDKLDQALMKNEVQENYIRIEREVNLLLKPFEKK